MNDTPQGNEAGAPSVDEIEGQIGLAESIVEAYKNILGLWYWKFPKIRHHYVFYPLITILTLYGGVVGYVDGGLQETVFKGSIGIVVSVTSIIIGNVVHNLWPKPANHIPARAQEEVKLLIRSLSTMTLVLLVVSLIMHNVLGDFGVLGWVNASLPRDLGSLFWIKDVIHGAMASALALLAMFLVEVIRKRRCDSSKVVSYVAMLFLISTGFTALISILWL